MTDKRIKTGQQLADAGVIPASRVADIERVASRYSVGLTQSVVSMLDASGTDDAIARQFIPDTRELDTAADEQTDPIGDERHSPVKGIVHRYPDRVLLAPTHVCSVYCRYCFRREFVGSNSDGLLSDDELANCFAYIREHPEIWEVILTGGDPLSLSVRRLRRILDELDAIPHVRVIRIHSRVPTVAPERVGPDLLQLMAVLDTTMYVIVHVNHPLEMTEAALGACASIIDAGVPLLSQSVLLRGVNDDLETLGTLMRTLVENRIKPYYLHHCDLAPGTRHFRVSIETGQRLMRELRGRYSGLCQPSYVLDIPGGAGKSPIGPVYLDHDATSESHTDYRIEDYKGAHHHYRCDTDPPDNVT